jgi:hypothetical protein
VCVCVCVRVCVCVCVFNHTIRNTTHARLFLKYGWIEKRSGRICKIGKWSGEGAKYQIWEYAMFLPSNYEDEANMVERVAYSLGLVTAPTSRFGVRTGAR